MAAFLSSKLVWDPRWAGLFLMLAIGGNAGALAAGPDVNFDFARLAEYRDVTPADRAKRSPDERLIAVKLPISVRYQGLANGEIEHLDIEIDGTAAGLRVECFAPTTKLTSEAMSIQSTTTTKIGRSLGATLGAGLPVPVGAIVAEVSPSVTAGTSKSDEATEKVFRLPPKLPVVVSGTFAQGQAVFFKFKQSTQTSLEGVHELEITFVAPADWKGGNVRIACTARGHKPLLWMDKPAIFAHVDDEIELYPQGDTKRSAAAAHQTQRDSDSSVRQASFIQEAAAEVKSTLAKAAP